MLRCCMRWNHPGDAGIFGNADDLPDGYETGALIKRKRLWMVERAGIDRQFLSAAGPCGIYGAVEQEWSQLHADELGDHPEIAEIDRILAAPVQLREAGRHSADIEHGDLHLWILDHRC